MSSASFFTKQLNKFKSDGLFRTLKVSPHPGGKFELNGRVILNFSSNDYLNLASDARLKAASAAALNRYGCSASASRLMSGHLELHEELEKRLSMLCGCEAALCFGSGFLTNLGALSAVAVRGTSIFADRLNHASLVDGARLSGAKLFRYRHADTGDLERRLRKSTSGRKVIVSDSVFSMDGDIAPLEDLSFLARKYDAALFIDEAHAIGVFGPGGGGICRDSEGVSPDFLVGTLSKALGGYGGFTAGSFLSKEFLVNRARSFIYSTGLPPACAGSALGGLDVLETDKDLGGRLLKRAGYFRNLLSKKGFDTGNSVSQIVPLMVGDKLKTVEFSRRLLKEGILAVAIRPPTVPAGSSRLRMSITLAHTESDLAWAAERIASAGRDSGLPQ